MGAGDGCRDQIIFPELTRKLYIPLYFSGPSGSLMPALLSVEN
jgi:hypothetical protein